MSMAADYNAGDGPTGQLIFEAAWPENAGGPLADDAQKIAMFYEAAKTTGEVILGGQKWLLTEIRPERSDGTERLRVFGEKAG